MTKFDLSTLPAPLADYFAEEDHIEKAKLFAGDGIVRDEGRIHNGAVEIAAWVARVETDYQPRYSVEDWQRQGERDIVTFSISGTFPGSPIVLSQAFTLKDGKIAVLETL
jgi:hypothetical protein